MRENFETLTQKVLVHEGGYVNHPRDPGGATNKGVTQAVYDRYRLGVSRYVQSVQHITREEVYDIYKTGYWDKVKGDKLPSGVDYSSYDAAINSGPSRSIKWLQGAVNAIMDGKIGRETLDKVLISSPVITVKRMCAARLGFVQSLRTWSTFGRGWSRRIAEVEAVGVRMAGADLSEQKKDAEQDERVAKKKRDGAATGGVATGGGTVVMQDTMSIIIVGLMFALVVVAFIIFWKKKRDNRERVDAYERAINGEI